MHALNTLQTFGEVQEIQHGGKAASGTCSCPLAVCIFAKPGFLMLLGISGFSVVLLSGKTEGGVMLLVAYPLSCKRIRLSRQWWIQAGEALGSEEEALAEAQPVHSEEEREEGTITLPPLNPQAAKKFAEVEHKLRVRKAANLAAAQAKAAAALKVGVFTLTLMPCSASFISLSRCCQAPIGSAPSKHGCVQPQFACSCSHPHTHVTSNKC